jgi:hypothetical protein
MNQPRFVETGREDHLRLVLKALYGTKQAPYLFGEKLKKRVIASSAPGNRGNMEIEYMIVLINIVFEVGQSFLLSFVVGFKSNVLFSVNRLLNMTAL